MPPLSLIESRNIATLADVLYDFLPGTPRPGANIALSYPGVCQKLGLQKYWLGGSKKPAITALLTNVLENERGKFCKLIEEIVKTAFAYRPTKNPIVKEQIIALNAAVQGVGFKIPEFWDPAFLASLPPTNNRPAIQENEIATAVDTRELSKEFLNILKLAPQQRGFAFEKLLNNIFAAFDLAPHASFRLIGEQIDGSLQLDSHTYLVEAKWTQNPTAQSDLLVFRSKVDAKAAWSRGLFISYSGFTAEGLAAFATGRSTNIISLTGEDIHFVLEGKINLPDLLRKKARKAAETGAFHTRAYDFLNG